MRESLLGVAVKLGHCLEGQPQPQWRPEYCWAAVLLIPRLHLVPGLQMAPGLHSACMYA